MDKRWLVGFIEGEGCFNISFSKQKSNKFEYYPKATFVIKLTESEKEVVEKIRSFLGDIGNIYHESSESTRKMGLKNARDCVSIRVTKTSELLKIVELLENEQFISQQNKRDFKNWAKAVKIINKKEHLTKKGYIEIAKLREQMHTRKHPKKKGFCELRNAIDPCEAKIKYNSIPKTCNTCLEHK